MCKERKKVTWRLRQEATLGANQITEILFCPVCPDKTTGKVSTNAFGTNGPALPGRPILYHRIAALPTTAPSSPKHRPESRQGLASYPLSARWEEGSVLCPWGHRRTKGYVACVF